jgi:4-hydroxy-3-methylbut-2-enyl diphosphate reductase
VLVAKPRGYCAGVDRAVVTVEKALQVYGAPVYVRKQIVHNAHVVRTLEAKGAIFVDETEEVPEGATVVFSAHGVAPTVHAEAAVRQLKTIDATCPLVTKVHLEARRFAKDDLDIVLIGHEGHEEVVGTTGQAPANIHLVDGVEEAQNVQVRDPARVAYLSQTTLSVDETNVTVDALRQRFPLLQGPPSADICYATQNRQVAVKEIAGRSDLLLVVGSRNSSNSVRLVEVALEAGSARVVPRRRRRRDRRGVARGRVDGRPDQRRVGARAARRAGHGVARRARLRRRRAGRVGAGAHGLRAAAGAAPRPAHRRHRRELIRRASLSFGCPATEERPGALQPPYRRTGSGRRARAR